MALLIALPVLLLFAAFFSGAETALTAASRAKLRALAEKGARGAQAALAIAEDRERMIGALLLGRTAAKVALAALATLWLIRLEGGVALAVAGATLALLVFAEVLPRALAVAFPETAATALAAPAGLAIALLSPVVTVIRALVRGLLRLVGIHPDAEGRMLAMREEIEEAIAQGHSGGAVEKEDRDRLLGALQLGDRTVEEVMKHRRQIAMLDADAAPDAILSAVLASPHTRLPLWRGEPENIVGVIHAKDLLREVERLVRGGEGTLADLDVVKVAMKPYFVPETTPLDEQMREFLKRRTHFALVVDEYGALQGLITLEDIIEEIVGDIRDEFDVVKKEDAPSRDATGAYLVDGAMTIRDLNRAMDWALPDDEANTIAGLVIHEAQMIPLEGQVFSFHGFRFEVLERRENRLTRLRIRPLS